MNPEDKLREKWPWNGEFLRMFLVWPTLLGIAAAGVSYPIAGVHALWFLTSALAGGLFYLVYGSVGRRVSALKEQYINDPNEIAEGLLVIDKIECPGIVIMRDNELELVPIIGKPCVLQFKNIQTYKEGRWLPGKFVWGKRAFNFGTKVRKRLAFAVADSIGAHWSSRLPDKKKE